MAVRRVCSVTAMPDQPQLIAPADSGSYEDFARVYRPGVDTDYRGAGARTLLFYALQNRDIDARIAIANLLLDDGVDASVVSGNLNVLHVFFGNGPHDPDREAPLLNRMIDAGADINQVSKKWGPPLITLVEHEWRSADPFQEALFSRPDLDLSAPYGRTTVRGFILDGPWNLPALVERIHAYDAEHPDR